MLYIPPFYIQVLNTVSGTFDCITVTDGNNKIRGEGQMSRMRMSPGAYKFKSNQVHWGENILGGNSVEALSIRITS